MSKKFYAVHRETGERWKPSNQYTKDYLVMYDSGYLARVMCDGFYYYIEPLDISVWKTINKFKIKHKIWKQAFRNTILFGCSPKTK